VKTILFITDRTDKVDSYRKTFIELEWSVEVYNSIELARKRIENQNMVTVIVCETRVKGSAIDGLSFARKMSKHYPVVLMSSKDEFVLESKQNGFVAFKRTGQSCDNIFNRVARATDLFIKEQSHEKLKSDVKTVKQDFHSIKESLNILDARIDKMTELLESHSCFTDKKQISDDNGEQALLKANKFLVSARKSPVLSLAVIMFLMLASVAGVNYMTNKPYKYVVKK